MDGFNWFNMFQQLDMWKFWKSLEIISPRVSQLLGDLTNSSKWPCISRSNASSGAGATSTPVRTPNLPRLTAALPQHREQMLAISMKKMWFGLLNLNVCTKLTLDLNLDTFDTFTRSERSLES